MMKYYIRLLRLHGFTWDYMRLKRLHEITCDCMRYIGLHRVAPDDLGFCHIGGLAVPEGKSI